MQKLVNFINQLKIEVKNSFKINFLEIEIEISSEKKTIEEHISSFVTKLTPIDKIKFILTNLRNSIEIDHYTFEYESINTICSQLLINILEIEFLNSTTIN